MYEASGEAIIWRESPPGRSTLALGVPAAGSATPEARTGGRALGDLDGENVARSARRARGRVRRYAAANGCARLATFTYRVGRVDRQQVKADWARFARELRARRPGLAWVRVLELHPGGHGLHVHAGLSEYVPQGELARLWGHGIVDVRKIRGRRGGREDARAAARYLAKYATKDRATAPREHGYEVAQGFQPVAVRVRAWDGALARLAAISAMGGEVPAYEWSSGSCEDWRGPPVVFLGWS